MFDNIDCMHRLWKAYPVALQWSFQNKDKKQSIILEVVCDHSLYAWHTFFGLHGGNNINVVDRFPLVHDMLNGDTSGDAYWVYENWYDMYYILVDGVYPKWALLCVKHHQPPISIAISFCINKRVNEKGH